MADGGVRAGTARAASERRAGAPIAAAIEPGVLGWLATAFGGLLLVGAVATEQNLPVVLPMVTATGVAGVFCWSMWRRERGGFPYFEIGLVYVAIVWLYSVFPLVGFLANGLRYTPFNDGRLFAARPTPAEVGWIGWYHVAHLASFVVSYLLWRGRVRPREPVLPRPDRATVLAAVFAYLMIGTYFLLLGWYFDLSAKTYMETYLVSRRLPLELAQLANHLGGAKFPLELVILAALFAGYRRRRLLIAAWIAVMVAATFIQLGSRTELVLLMAAGAMMYHHAVRSLRFWHVATFGVSGLSLFLLLGFLRAGGLSTLTGDVNPIFGYGTEFENNFANAYDLSRLKAGGAVRDLPLAFYLADLLALVPQQLLPVTKISPGVWYVSTFYPAYAAAGGGLAFGTIAEAIVGAGWVETMGRGAALGLLIGQVHRWYARRRPTFWGFVFYAWATMLVYQSFRGTTFLVVLLFVYRFVPVVIAVKLVASVLRSVPWSRARWAGARVEEA